MLGGACDARQAPPVYTVYAAGDIAYCDKKPALLSDANDTAKVVEAGLAASPASTTLAVSLASDSKAGFLSHKAMSPAA